MPVHDRFHAGAMKIVEVDPLTASDEVIQEIASHHLALWEERDSEEPKLPLQDMMTNIRNPPEETMKNGLWVIFDGPFAAAVASANINLMDTEVKTMFAYITVLPEYRRRGLATRLMDPLKEFARKHGKNCLIMDSSDRLPGGSQFLTHLGAEPGLETHVNRLVLRDLDRGLMQSWIDRAGERVQGIHLQFFEGMPPEALMDSYCQMLTHILETEPQGSIQFPYQKATPEFVREMFRMDEKTGYRHWTLVAIEETNGRIAGYTDVLYHVSTPQMIFQGGTSVFTEFRNRGIGRWLKAAMALKVVDELPEARWISTGNADVNAPMLKINYEMGFKPYQATCFWQYRFE